MIWFSLVFFSQGSSLTWGWAASAIQQWHTLQHFAHNFNTETPYNYFNVTGIQANILPEK